MNKIIYLDGSRSVGKTTLLKRIKKEHPDYVIIDGFARKEFSFNMLNLDEFLINEKLYMACDVAQYKIYKTIPTTLVIVKGPITDLLFAYRFAQLHYPELDLEDTELKEYILELEKCISDKTIYLSASKDTILKRYASDDHLRVTMDEFMNNFYEYFDKEYKNDKHTSVLDTENKSEDEVYQEFMKIIEEE